MQVQFVNRLQMYSTIEFLCWLEQGGPGTGRIACGGGESGGGVVSMCVLGCRQKQEGGGGVQHSEISHSETEIS